MSFDPEPTTTALLAGYEPRHALTFASSGDWLTRAKIYMQVGRNRRSNRVSPRHARSES